jgi:hypothetical protein
MVPVPSDFLVSPGQTLTVGVSVEHMPPSPAPGSDLERLKPGVRCVDIEPTYDYSLVPTNRPLWAIVQDMTDHAREFPTHGASCVCMDDFAREIKQQISRGLPPDNGEAEDVHWRVNARHRVAYVLGMVERWV